MSRGVQAPWDASFSDRSPAFAPLRFSAAALKDEVWPSAFALQRLLDESQPRPSVSGGHALRLVAQVRSAEPYERQLFRSGELSMRPESWHDVFNVLAWIAFPLAKAALNAAHVRAMAGEVPGRRGSERDALTQFDEDGMIVLSSSPDLLALIRAFRWKELFWSRREELTRHVCFLAFGHALYEKLLAPFAGLTGKAALFEVAPQLLAAPLQTQIAAADRQMAAMLDTGLVAAPAVLQPLPVLGIPGWSPGTMDAAFYGDTSYFRPGRRNVSVGRTAL